MAYFRTVLNAANNVFPGEAVLCAICLARAERIVYLAETETDFGGESGPAVALRTRLPRLSVHPCGHEQEVGAPPDAPLGRPVVIRAPALIFWPGAIPW